MIFVNSLFGDLICLFLTLVVAFILYCKWVYQYWKRKNLPYLEAKIPYGSLAFVDVLKGKEHIGMAIKRVYKEAKAKGWRHGGVYMFLSLNYFVIDLEYIKNIMTKDFQHFVDRNIYFNEEDDPLSGHLANITGTRWKNMRNKLTPTFTSGKMKMMFQTLVDCEVSLQKRMEVECLKKEPIDIKEILACFTTDIIGSVAFGLDCKSFEDEDSPFRYYGRKMFDHTPADKLKRTLSTLFPRIAKLLHVTSTKPEVAKFFMKVVEDTVNYREKNNYTRKDFMQMLIDLKNNKFVEDDGKKFENTSLTMNELAAQCFVFFGGGFETSSTLMTFALYEMAKNQDVQEKLRKEIKNVLAKHDGKITYDAIQDMKYMNQVIDETLRYHPPAALTNRKCVKDYKVPDCDLVIEKGTTVIIPIIGIHYDEEYYQNPEEFNPEHFSDENRSSRPSYTLLPFGEGPRNCIGLRFGLMQAKVGLTSLIRNFKFTVNSKTREPLKMDPSAIIFSVDGGVWLNAEKV